MTNALSKMNPALAGNRTRVNCLEGSYAHHYTTNALIVNLWVNLCNYYMVQKPASDIIEIRKQNAFQHAILILKQSSYIDIDILLLDYD